MEKLNIENMGKRRNGQIGKWKIEKFKQ